MMTFRATKLPGLREKARVRKLVERNRRVQFLFACLLVWKMDSLVPRAETQFALITIWQDANCPFSRGVVGRDYMYVVSKDASSRTIPMHRALCESRTTDMTMACRFHTWSWPGAKTAMMVSVTLQWWLQARWAQLQVSYSLVLEMQHLNVARALS